MNRSEAFHSMAIASVLAAFLVMPSLADDLTSRQTQPAEPIYVWQGNRINDPSIPQAQKQVPSAPAPASISESATAAPTAPVSSSDLPQPVQAGSARYITGGIGSEERDALDAVKNQYNLRIISASAGGEFDGDTKISIRDASGGEILNADSGPLFFADLPSGTYTIEAVSGGQSQRKKAAVTRGKPLTMYLRWQ